MKACLYDPRIGRFFSPDNYITDPENPQNYNRYSYALNNPLSYVDPSGNVQIPMYGGNAAGTPNCMEYVLTAIMGNLQNLYALTCAMQYLLMSPGTMIELSARDLLDGFIPYAFYADAQYDKSNWQRGKLPLDLTFDEGSIWVLAPEGQEKVKKEHEQMELNYDMARAQFESLNPDYEIPFGVEVIPEDGRWLAKQRGDNYYVGLAVYKTNKLYIDSYTLLYGNSRPINEGYGGMQIPWTGKPILGYHWETVPYSLLDALAHETGHFVGWLENNGYQYILNKNGKEKYAIDYTNNLRKKLGLPLQNNPY